MRPNTHLTFFIAVALAFLPDSCAHFARADGPKNAVAKWPQWRGLRQDGHSDDARAPLVWGQGENLKWHIDPPGFGNSSPVVWQDRVFLIPNDGTRYTFDFLYDPDANGGNGMITFTLGGKGTFTGGPFMVTTCGG